ncbi:MAG: IS66 family transposase [Thiotrichales bacterium]
MSLAAESLPDDVAELQKIVRQQAAEIASQQHHILHLTEQLNLAIQKRFAAQSEKHSPDQLGLFNEAEALEQEDAASEALAKEEAETIEVPAHQRKKPGRKPLPEMLPRVEVIHDLDEADKICPYDGQALKHIGDEISEQLDIIPAKIQVLRHIRRKYTCPCCQQGVTTAALPKQPIPKSQASPGLLAYIIVSKYADALPLYRQSKMFERIGADINRATLANWMIKCGQLIQPLINLMQEKILDYDIIQMDETRVQVLKENNRPAQSQSWMWVQRGGPPDQRLILYHYNPSRSQQVPKQLLQDYRGYLQVDGYDAYNAVVADNSLTHVGCFAHARRKFDEALKAQRKNKQKASSGKAQMGLAFIQKLYRIEKACKDSRVEDRYQIRQQQAVPILNDLKVWLDKSLPQVPPQSLVGKALHYLNNQWPQLIRYGEDGRLEIDNNACERAIRPFALGRKNWLCVSRRRTCDEDVRRAA